MNAFQRRPDELRQYMADYSETLAIHHYASRCMSGRQIRAAAEWAAAMDRLDDALRWGR